ncbi:MAG: AhpC/TSA family protein [Aureispira sp.]|nr:AhpC/TSA family protein [Aureispira sp.]
MKFFLLLLTILVIDSNIAAQDGFKTPLEIGTLAPSFEGIDQEEQTISSTQLLEKGPVVLIFYRGAWCPYCKKHIHELQENLKQLTDKGASVVVVTPEKPQYIEKMISKTGATFSILYDQNYSIMQAYKVDYKISTETVTKYKGFVKGYTRKHSGNKEDILPIPATYIIRKDGIINYVHFDRDYTQRSSIEVILKHL